MTLYDGSLPVASQAMVRFLLSSQCSMLLNDSIARTHRKVDWNAQLFTTRWSRWGQYPTFLFDYLSKLRGQL